MLKKAKPAQLMRQPSLDPGVGRGSSSEAASAHSGVSYFSTVLRVSRHNQTRVRLIQAVL